MLRSLGLAESAAAQWADDLFRHGDAMEIGIEVSMTCPQLGDRRYEFPVVRREEKV
jgi:hypothetical protein